MRNKPSITLYEYIFNLDVLSNEVLVRAAGLKTISIDELDKKFFNGLKYT